MLWDLIVIVGFGQDWFGGISGLVEACRIGLSLIKI